MQRTAGKHFFRLTLLTIIILPVCLLGFSGPATAQSNPPPAEDILNGFADDAPNTRDDQDLELLEGFEDGPATRPAEPKDEDDALLEEFEETDDTTIEATEHILPASVSLDGYIELAASYNLIDHQAEGTDTDWDGLSKLRGKLYLEMDMKFSDTWQGRVAGKAFYDAAYRIRGRNEYTEEVLDENESEIEPAEVYIMGSLTRNLDVKAGRQIVVWGKSDNIRVTDVLNPLDLREPGLADIEDLRLPVTMTKLDLYLSSLNFSSIFVHEIRYNKNPEFGSDFFPGSAPLPTSESPDEGFDNMEFAAALNGTFRGWDSSLYGAYIYDDTLQTTKISEGGKPKIRRPRLQMVGAALNLARGNWLYKTEAAFLKGFEFFNTGDKEFSRLDVLAGVEYSGFKDTTVSFEIANRRLFEHQSVLRQAPDFTKKDQFQSVVRITKDLLHERLTLTLLASTFNITGQDGAFQRFTAEYDVTDAIKVSGGLILYQSGDLLRFKDIGDNDRLFADIRFSF